MGYIARIMKPGDEVLSVTPKMVAIQRANGEVDIYRLVDEEILKMDSEPSLIIAYEEAEEEISAEKGARLFRF